MKKENEHNENYPNVEDGTIFINEKSDKSYDKSIDIDNSGATYFNNVVGDEIFIPQGQKKELDSLGIKSPMFSSYKYLIHLHDTNNTVVFTNKKERYEYWKGRIVV